MPSRKTLKIHFNIIPPSTPGLPSGLFLKVSPAKPCMFLSPPRTCYMSRPSYSSWFYHRIIFGKNYRSLSSSLYSFLHSLVTPFLLDPNILLNSLFSETLSLRSSLDVSDQMSHPYKTTRKFIVVCIFRFVFFNSKLEGRTFCTEWQQASPDFSPFLISWWMKFWFIRLVSKHMDYLENYCQIILPWA
jgi:hypothetical protein